MSVDRLDEMREKPARFAIGLMSGSSCDGIDAALVRLKGTGESIRVKLVAFQSTPYPDGLKKRLLDFKYSVRDLTALNTELGEHFGRAALALKEKADADGTPVDFIASHGHTVTHVPPRPQLSGYGTMQIGEPAYIAQAVGVPVLSDFRPRDMAAGGQGAPLVPYADWALFQRTGKPLVCLNIGGIANMTVVTPKLEEVFAFDTGPGNMPIDGAIRLLTRGRHDMDWEGANAAKGKVIEELLNTLLEHPYFTKAPPKSTGREEFGADAYLPDDIVKRHNYTPEDVLATITKAVATSIAQAYKRFVAPQRPVSMFIVSGGGAKNKTLMSMLVQELNPMPMLSSDQTGLPGDAKEAVAFAILGNELIMGTPANVPAATGANHPCMLGKITLG